MGSDPFANAFASVAEEYERGRPGYPDAALERLQAELGLADDSTVVDLAAGTGKLTRQLIPKFGRVIAVEPLTEMLAVLRERVPGAEGLEGSADAIPLPDGSTDAVLVAQAFHWFAGMPALEEIARVLRPGRGLGLLWNSTPWEAREGPWFSAVDDVLERSRADLAKLRRHASGEWRKAFDGQDLFSAPESESYPNPSRVPPDEFMAAFASRSYVAAMAKPDRDELLADIRSLLKRDDAPFEGPDLVVPMRTDVVWTQRKRRSVRGERR